MRNEYKSERQSFLNIINNFPQFIRPYGFQIVFFISFLLMWHWISTVVNIDYILPAPLKVVQYFKNEITILDAVKHIGSTLLRVIIGYTVALCIALILSILATVNQVFEKTFNQIVMISKTVPTISIILIALIWLKDTKSTYLIAILVVFPLLYDVFYNSIKRIDPKLLDVSYIYRFTFKKKLRTLYIPSILMNLALSLKQTFGLCFKVMVMAEVLGQAGTGIGSRIYQAKMYLEMSGVFAWTLLLIILVLLIDRTIVFLIEKQMKWMCT